MSNNSGGINITAVFRAEGLDLVQSQVVQANASFQQFAAEQTALYNKGVIGSQTYLNSLRQEKTELDNLTSALNVQKQAQEQANAAALDGATRNQSYASALGTSRSAMADVVRELGAATGAGGEFTRTLTAGLSGMGPLTVALVAGAAALSIYTSWLDQAAKKEQELSAVRVRSAAGVRNAQAQADDKSQTAAMEAQAAALTKQIAALEAGMTSADRRTRDFATAQAVAAGGVDNLKARLDALNASIDFIKGKSIFDSAKANEVVTFTEQVWDANAATKADAQALDLADIALNKVASSGQVTVDAFGNLSVVTRDATGALIDFNAEGAKTFDVNQNIGKSAGDAAAMRKFAADESVKAMITAGNEAKRITDQATRQAEADYKTQMKQTADLNEYIRDASTQMTQVQVNNMMLIANSAEPLAEKLKMIQAYVSSLSNAKEINLAVTFAGNTDLMKALGLGGAQPASHDFMKEMEATFAQQLPAIQQKFVQAAGGNKDQAIQDWQKAHMEELIGKLLGDPKAFANVPGQLNQIQAALAKPAQVPMAGAGVPAGGVLGSAAGVALGQADASGMAGTGTQAGDAFTTGIGKKLSEFKSSIYMAQGLATDTKAWIDMGMQAGGYILDGMLKKAKDSDFITAWVKAAMPELDRYYKRVGAY